MKSLIGSANPNYKGGRKPCSVTGCGKKSVAFTLCIGHYQRLKKTGDIMAGEPLSKCHLVKRNPHWKGGVMVNGGRIYIHKPSHPYATKLGYVARYRLVMESTLGRTLLPSEIVHHKNNIPDDDRPENLEVMTQSKHATKHSSKTSLCVVQEIRRIGNRQSAKSLALRLGIPLRRVYSIRNRETWKEVL